MKLEFDDLIDDFVTEALEHLGDVESLLLSLETSSPEDAAESVQKVFRAVHSVKGTAGFVGLTQINQLAHAAENILDQIRSKELAATIDVIDVLLRAIDLLRSMVSDARASNAVDVAELVIALNDVSGHKSIAVVSEPIVIPPTAPAPEAQPIATSSPAVMKPAAPAAPVSEPAKSAPPVETAKVHADANIRVPIATLDRLMNLAGELVLTRNRLLKAIATRQVQTLEAIGPEVDQVTCDLQETIMRTRMQPIGNVFSRFSRVVRDLSSKLGKQCDLVVEGREVEVDKSIAEAIGDPLSHLIRNSLDHGLEKPETRTQKGKSALGKIRLAAFHRSGKVCIEIEDDGAGIPVAKIKAKAVSQGLITEEHASRMPEREALRLIFAPGFSTAAQITDVSGRGVGMDVVRTNIEKLGGTVDVETREGKGTTIRLMLPLTLAIVPALIVEANERAFAIPQANVSELLHISEEEIDERIQTMKGARVLRLRDTLLPLFHLRQGLELDNSGHANADKPEKTSVSVIVVEAGILRFGLMVDHLRDSEEIVVKPLGRHLKSCKMFAGAAVLGDGAVALILDISGLAQQLELARSNSTASEEKQEDQRQQLACDDQSMLVFNGAPNEIFAAPMALVSRLERVRTSAVQKVASQELLPYRKGTLPILRLENLIDTERPEDADLVYVIVFNSQGREVGLLAPEIWDIRTCPSEIDDSTFHEGGVIGHVLIEEKTVRVLDLQSLAQKAFPTANTGKTKSVSSPEFSGDQVTVMVAEDSSFFRRHLATALIENGFNVLEAEDGQDALEQLQSGETWVDLLVTDIEMPRLSGLELTRALRLDSELCDMPIIAVTSLAGEEDVHRGREAGVDEYHVKMDREQLITAVTGLLQSKPRAAQRPVLAGANA